MGVMPVLFSSLAALGLGVNECLTPKEVNYAVETAVVRVEIALPDGEVIGHGTGTVFNEERFVITSDHVVPEMIIEEENAKVWVVRSDSGERFEYKVKARVNPDATALLVPNSVKRPLNFLNLKITAPNVGDRAYALGYPYSLGTMFKAGIVSQVHHTEEHPLLKTGEVFLVDMMVNPGMSGGALFDCRTNVMGFTLGTFGSNASIAIFNAATSDVPFLLDKTQYKYGD